MLTSGSQRLGEASLERWVACLCSVSSGGNHRHLWMETSPGWDLGPQATTTRNRVAVANNLLRVGLRQKPLDFLDSRATRRIVLVPDYPAAFTSALPAKLRAIEDRSQ